LFKLYWLRAGKKTLTSPSRSSFNQPRTIQASNNLRFQAFAKLKPPKIPEISVETMSTHNTKKMPFLLYYLIRSMNVALHINSLCSTRATIQNYFV